LAPTNALMATSASPPGRFSTTTGWPQRLVSRSASSRVPMSMPLPGPSVTRNLTGRCGQFCAADGIVAPTSVASASPTANNARWVQNMDPSKLPAPTGTCRL
jgi:hypothetical protein